MFTLFSKLYINEPRYNFLNHVQYPNVEINTLNASEKNPTHYTCLPKEMNIYLDNELILIPSWAVRGQDWDIVSGIVYDGTGSKVVEAPSLFPYILTA